MSKDDKHSPKSFSFSTDSSDSSSSSVVSDSKDNSISEEVSQDKDMNSGKMEKSRKFRFESKVSDSTKEVGQENAGKSVERKKSKSGITGISGKKSFREVPESPSPESKIADKFPEKKSNMSDSPLSGTKAPEKTPEVKTETTEPGNAGKSGNQKSKSKTEIMESGIAGKSGKPKSKSDSPGSEPISKMSEKSATDKKVKSVSPEDSSTSLKSQKSKEGRSELQRSKRTDSSSSGGTKRSFSGSIRSWFFLSCFSAGLSFSAVSEHRFSFLRFSYLSVIACGHGRYTMLFSLWLLKLLYAHKRWVILLSLAPFLWQWFFSEIRREGKIQEDSNVQRVFIGKVSFVLTLQQNRKKIQKVLETEPEIPHLWLSLVPSASQKNSF